MEKKSDKLCIKWKGYNNSFNRWREIVQMSEDFVKPTHSEPLPLVANVKVELNLSNYAIKADLKNTTVVDESDFAKKTDLANLKSDVDKLDIDKSKKIPSGLSSLESKVDKSDI